MIAKCGSTARSYSLWPHIAQPCARFGPQYSVVSAFACGLALTLVPNAAALAQIVVRYSGSERALATWRVDQRPTLTIEAAQLPFSRVTGAVRLNDGRVVVADRDTRMIHYFDRTGRLLRTVGGLGKGPGEFEDIDHFERRGGNLVVYDGNHAVHLLDADSGRLVRRVALTRVPGFVPNPAVGVMRDQSVLFAARRIERPRTEPGTFSDSLALFRVSDTTALVEWFPTEVMHRASGARAAYLVGFGARTRQVVFDDRRCHGSTARYEIRCTSPAGRLLLTIVREIPARPVTNRERTAYRRALSGFRSDGSNRFQDASLRAHRARVAEQTAFAKTHPAWFDLMASQSGDLWIRDYAAADGARSGYVVFPEAASTWSVFNAHGKWLASVTLPKGFVPTDIGDDYVLGVTQDEDEVERASMYRLIRTP